MPVLPLYGHVALRQRLRESIARGALPGSVLLHGPRGVGKQQLALWVGRLLLCERPDAAPCSECRSCRMGLKGQHPDLQWFFPRPRLKESDAEPDEIRADMAEAIDDRLRTGVYEAPSGEEGIFVATVAAIVQSAALSPAMASRKVFVVGDADRMVAQEGAEYAANAFLKLLEEPPANTTILLTSSEPGALLPTIRSRVVGVRVSPIADADVHAFLDDATVARQLDPGSRSIEELVHVAGGAPGRLVGRESWESALGMAARLLEAAASHDRGPRFRVALAQGAAGARGRFSDVLEALSVVLHERVRAAVSRGNAAAADGAARGIEAVERAKELASGNVSPQLVTASLLQTLAPLVQ